MCGIVGYVGNQDAENIVLNGLRSLEYRGYDSAGIAVIQEGKIALERAVGEINNLEAKLKGLDFHGNTAIGHTRWATHGIPSEENAHPHISSDGKISIVHNGIIENYHEIKEELIKEHNLEFYSQTDSEVIAKIIGVFYEGDLLEAVNKTIEKLKGAYAFCAIAADEPDKIVAVRKDAPLIAGIGKGCNFLASDIPAILKHTRETYLIDNDEVVLVTKDNITIYDKDGNIVNKEVFHVTWDAEDAEKGGYEHFMLKEIYEQPEVVKESLIHRLEDDNSIKLDGVNLTKTDLDNIKKVFIVACGTAYHAGLTGKYTIEKFAKIPVEVELASEFRYNDPLVDEHTLVICVSQSGETLDTLSALREAKKKGARILSIVNVVGSSVARESDDVFYTWAGPEIAVASTKAFTTQLVCMYLLGMYFGTLSGELSKEKYNELVAELTAIPEKITEILKTEEKIVKIAEKIYKTEEIFFIGRGQDVSISYEGSLKLKEISYINSFAIAAGELKHGTITLVKNGTPFIAISTQSNLYGKMVSNIEEVKARGAHIISVAKADNKEIANVSDEVISIPVSADEVTPLLSVIPLQLIAYHVAKLRGESIDKPKNLAKSVTVE